jgi:hypothetical protein
MIDRLLEFTDINRYMINNNFSAVLKNNKLIRGPCFADFEGLFF